MINETIQTIVISQSTHNTNLLIIYFFIISLLPILTMIFKNKGTNWGNFWKVWFALSFLSGIILVFIIIRPTVISDIINKTISFIGL
jgi:ABC-type sulfate transport system permease component